MKEFMRDQPISRPNEINAATLWLCSAGAGVVLPVDGGVGAH